MDNLIGVLILLGLLSWICNSAYSSGKREGSRKGFGVGYARGRQRRPPSGCLIISIAIATLAISAGAIAASLL